MTKRKLRGGTNRYTLGADARFVIRSASLKRSEAPESATTVTGRSHGNQKSNRPV
jgi:hypothetical protein